MKIKEISYTKEELIPTGSYANKKFGATITYVLEDGESANHEKARLDLQNAIDAQKIGLKEEVEMETHFPDTKSELPPWENSQPITTNRLVETVKRVAQVSRETQESNECPKCGNPLVKKEKKDGTPFWKCSDSKWNPKTKEATGCDYVRWSNAKPTQQPSRPASMAQERIIKEKWPEEWVDGMTMTEAYEVIKAHPKA